MKAKHLFLPFAMLFVALFIGCAKDDFVEVPGVCPLVVSTSPDDGEINVVLDKIITATFNEPMDPATFNASSFIVTESTAAKSTAATTISGTITFSGVTASFDPASPLTVNTIYTGTIKTSVKDFAGNALQEDYVWTFSTGSFLPPTVISNFPDVDAIDVEPVDLEITATFSQKMLASSITAESTFTLRQGGILIPGTVSYVDSTATFIPESDLELGEIYTATISTAAMNLDNIAMLNDYVWSFTTLAPNPPEITAIDPYNLETGVLLDKVISATFNEEMDASTITDLSFTLMDGTTPITGVVDYSGLIATFTPEIDLLPNTTYEATITTGVMNLDGIALENDSVWSFTTAQAPRVISTDPLDLATEVAVDKIISATFSEEMDPLTITDLSFTLMDGTTSINGLVEYSGLTATFTPDSDLLPSTTYEATITTGAMNLAGIAIESDYVWTFTTINAPPPSGLFFGVFGGNAGITNQGLYTVVNGKIGTTAASTLVTGFTDGTNTDVYTVTPLNNGLVTEGIYAAAPPPGNATNAAIALEGLNAATDLYLSISPALMPGGAVDPGAGELGGLTLAPGIYTASSSFDITNGDLTLDAQGDPNAKWYFQAPSTLTVGDSQASSVVFLSGVGNPNNVYWYVGSSAVINYAGGGVMVGNIIANSGVTLSSPANSTNASVTTLNGRAISLVSSVTMVNTVINVPTN